MGAGYLAVHAVRAIHAVHAIHAELGSVGKQEARVLLASPAARWLCCIIAASRVGDACTQGSVRVLRWETRKRSKDAFITRNEQKNPVTFDPPRNIINLSPITFPAVIAGSNVPKAHARAAS